MNNKLSFWDDKDNKIKVPFWNPKKINKGLNTRILRTVCKLISSGNLVLGYGDYIEKFEVEYAKFLGRKYAVMCGSGTQALTLAYKGLGLKKGDEVITTSHTFIATIDQIAQIGAKPILVDIGEDGLIDPKEIEKSITKRTKAISVVHLEGNVCKMKEIMAIAKKYKLIVIEDACQAIGANLKYITNAQCYSFYPAKILGVIGNAGMLVTNDKKLADKAKLLRANNLIGKNKDLKVGFGWNLEPDNIQAAVLSIKLKELPSVLKKRNSVAERYNKEFIDLPITLPPKNKNRVYQDYVIRTEKRDELVMFLNKNGIGVRGNALIPNHYYDIIKCKLPKTELYLKQQIRIACNPYITKRQVSYIIKIIKKFYEKSIV